MRTPLEFPTGISLMSRVRNYFSMDITPEFSSRLLCNKSNYIELCFQEKKGNQPEGGLLNTHSLKLPLRKKRARDAVSTTATIILITCNTVP